MSSIELSEFCRQIALMVNSGIVLLRALEILCSTTEKKRLRDVYATLQKELRRGRPLSEAMRTTGMFPEMAVNMFHAAEMSGRLGETAERLAVHYQKEHKTKIRIQNALLYPRLLCVMALIMVLTIFLVIMPTIEPLLEETELPLITKILMSFSIFVKDKWYLAILIVISPFLLWHILIRNKSFRRRWDKWKLRFPMIGKLLVTIDTARFAESLSSLHASGVEMMKVLETVEGMIGNLHLSEQIREAAARVREGERLSLAIQETCDFDRKLAAVIYVGEETGELDHVLSGLAQSYEYEADAAITKLTELLQPAIILALGVVIGLVLLGIMMPMWGMYENIG